MDTLAKIVDYENGILDTQEVIDLFQALIDEGTVWHMQSSYQHVARGLIENGLCRALEAAE